MHTSIMSYRLNIIPYALVVKLVDTRDLKSLDVRVVSVQVRLGAPSYEMKIIIFKYNTDLNLNSIFIVIFWLTFKVLNFFILKIFRGLLFVVKPELRINNRHNVKNMI